MNGQGHVVAFDVHPFCEIFPRTARAVLSPHDVVEPNLFYDLARTRGPGADPGAERVTPELTIEITGKEHARRPDLLDVSTSAWACPSIGWSTLERDTTRASSRRRSIRLAVELKGERGDLLTTPLLPDLEIAPTRIFAELMRLLAESNRSSRFSPQFSTHRRRRADPAA